MATSTVFLKGFILFIQKAKLQAKSERQQERERESYRPSVGSILPKTTTAGAGLELH